MRIAWLIILILSSMFWYGCKRTNETNCPVLPVALILEPIKVKIIDNTTGADLFLSPSSPYKFSDLTVTTLSGQNIQFYPDTANASDRSVVFVTYDSAVFSLKLGTLSADTVNMNVLITPTRCSETRTLNSVTVGKTVVCNPCTVNQLVVIKK